MVVGRHAYIRVHVHPKRFPAAYGVQWEVGGPRWEDVAGWGRQGVCGTENLFCLQGFITQRPCLCMHSRPVLQQSGAAAGRGQVQLTNCSTGLPQDRIIANHPEFVVLNKPAGVPVAPTVDNVIECAPAMAAKVRRHVRIVGLAQLCSMGPAAILGQRGGSLFLRLGWAFCFRRTHNKPGASPT